MADWIDLAVATPCCKCGALLAEGTTVREYPAYLDQPRRVRGICCLPPEMRPPARPVFRHYDPAVTQAALETRMTRIAALAAQFRAQLPPAKPLKAVPAKKGRPVYRGDDVKARQVGPDLLDHLPRKW